MQHVRHRLEPLNLSNKFEPLLQAFHLDAIKIPKLFDQLPLTREERSANPVPTPRFLDFITENLHVCVPPLNGRERQSGPPCPSGLKSQPLQELQKFAVFIIRRFIEVAQKNRKAYMELLFWKTTRDATEVVEGYNAETDNKKVSRSLWTEAQEDELRTLFMEHQTNNYPQGTLLAFPPNPRIHVFPLRGKLLRCYIFFLEFSPRQMIN